MRKSRPIIEKNKLFVASAAKICYALCMTKMIKLLFDNLEEHFKKYEG